MHSCKEKHVCIEYMGSKMRSKLNTISGHMRRCVLRTRYSRFPQNYSIVVGAWVEMVEDGTKFVSSGTNIYIYAYMANGNIIIGIVTVVRHTFYYKDGNV